MIPQHICKYTKFPLSLSGKTDLKTLGLSLEKNTKSSTSDYKKFESNTYTVIKELLGEVLISDYTLDLQCNFFELGGTSLLAIQFVRKINEFLNLNIKINTLFESKSIESFIEKVEETINGESI
ncbi:phosphopantetheine-binding protein [Streptococcus intermedius]